MTGERRLLSAADAEKVHGIPAGTVRSWWARRKFTGLWDYGRDKRGRPLFDEDDLLALQRRNAPRPKMRRPRGARSRRPLPRHTDTQC